MVRIEKIRKVDSRGHAVLDLQVSTVGELPNLGSEIQRRIYVCEGSIAQVIQSGSWYTLDENGTWYDENGDAAS